MRILIVSQYFYPEEFKVNDLAVGLVERGHEVTVLTGKPNYPRGRFYDGYGFRGTQRESYKGVKVVRVPVIARGRGGSLRLMANYLSFVLFGGWHAFFHKADYDAVFCFETSPITQAFPAIIVKNRCGCKLSMWVQDLWPESVAAASGIRNRYVIGAIAKMVSYIYRRCDTLPVQSERFRESILQKGAFEERIVYAPNWAEDIFTDRSHADREKYRNLIPSGFVVMFAGNIGEAQDFKSLMQAAALTREHRDIKWVIVGDGRKREYVERRIAQEGLSETVRMLGRFPVEHMPHLFVHADAMLVSLKKEYIFSLTIPSKTQAYMAFGKPVLTMIDGAGNDVIESARCGLCARAGDYEHLAENVLAMSRLSAEQREQMGQRGAEYYREHFEKSRVIDTLERIIIDTNRHET